MFSEHSNTFENSTSSTHDLFNAKPNLSLDDEFICGLNIV